MSLESEGPVIFSVDLEDSWRFPMDTDLFCYFTISVNWSADWSPPDPSVGAGGYWEIDIDYSSLSVIDLWRQYSPVEGLRWSHDDFKPCSISERAVFTQLIGQDASLWRRVLQAIEQSLD